MDKASSGTLRIGEVARHTGVTPDALRYWEREGLIPAAERRPSGYREFPASTVERVRFLLRAKRLGFSLEEIRNLVHLQESRASTSHEVREAVLARIRDLDARIEELTALRSDLRTLADRCDGHDAIEDCPILDHLSRCEGGCAHGLDPVA